MPNCDFYAVDRDIASILDFIFGQPGWVLVESASRHDRPLRRYRSTADVLADFDLAKQRAHLMLYAPETGGSIREQRVIFEGRAAREATGRTDAAGWGLIQLDLAPGIAERVGRSHTNCNSEARARLWEGTLADRLGPVDAWDMRVVKQASERLNRHIRKLGVFKHGSRPVLPMAAQRVANGAALAPN